MPKYAVQPHWRQRRDAIGRKGAMEAELVMESEISSVIGERTFELSGKQVYDPSSPISVASGFAAMESMPEMKPIMLPSAWVVVGKGGRPMKNLKMYEEPKKKKKKKTRSRKPAPQEDSVFGALHDLPSSSTAYRVHDISTMRHEKEAARGKEVKFWMRYQKGKTTKKLARDALLAVMLSDGVIDDEGGGVVTPPPSRRRRDVKETRHVKETRRHVRRAAAAARCGALFDDGESDESSAPTIGHAPSHATLRRSKERAKTPAGASRKAEYCDDRPAVAKKAKLQSGAGLASTSFEEREMTAWTRRPSKGRNCSMM